MMKKYSFSIEVFITNLVIYSCWLLAQIIQYPYSCKQKNQINTNNQMFSVIHSPLSYQVLCIFLFMNLKEKKGKNWKKNWEIYFLDFVFDAKKPL